LNREHFHVVTVLKVNALLIFFFTDFIVTGYSYALHTFNTGYLGKNFEMISFLGLCLGLAFKQWFSCLLTLDHVSYKQ